MWCLDEEDENGEVEERRKIEKRRGNFKRSFVLTVDFRRGMRDVMASGAHPNPQKSTKSRSVNGPGGPSPSGPCCRE